MNGIYPSYIGPTKRASHYPRWIDVLTENDLVVDPPVKFPSPGGPSGDDDYERPYYDTALSLQIKREDEEILAMIMAAIRIIQ